MLLLLILTCYVPSIGASNNSLLINLYKKVYKTSPNSGFIILIFNEDNCATCFMEYKSFWTKFAKMESAPPVFGLYVSQRPYTLKEIQKEYNIDIPVLSLDPDSISILLPDTELPKVLGITNEGQVKFSHKMGREDEFFNNQTGFMKMQQMALTLSAQKKLQLQDSIKIDEKDNIILGNFRVEVYNKSGYSIVDQKRKRLNLYDSTGKQVELFDFEKDSTFIGINILQYTYSKKLKDTIFCMGAKPLRIKKGATPEKDEYYFLPNLYVIHDNKFICDTFIPNASILPPFIVLRNSIIAKVMKWNAMQNMDSLRIMPTLVQFSRNGYPVRFFGKVDTVHHNPNQQFEFFNNDIIPESDSTIAILDYTSGNLNVFSDEGKLVKNFQYIPMSSSKNEKKFEFTQICRDQILQKYYILLTEKESKKQFITCLDKNGYPEWELIEVSKTVVNIIKGSGGNTVYLSSKKKNGIYIEKYIVN